MSFKRMNVRDHLNGRLITATLPWYNRVRQQTLKRPQDQLIRFIDSKTPPNANQTPPRVRRRHWKYHAVGFIPQQRFPSVGQRLVPFLPRCSGANASVSAMQQRYRTKPRQIVMPMPGGCRRASSIRTAGGFPHAAIVAPVVNTSSTTRKVASGIRMWIEMSKSRTATVHAAHARHAGVVAQAMECIRCHLTLPDLR